VSSDDAPPVRRPLRGILLGGALVIAGLGGAFVSNWLGASRRPSTERSAVERQARPIVQIVRQQPGLPDVADLVDRLCPSVATILPHGSDLPGPTGKKLAVAGFAFSADGWLVTSAADLPPMPLDALFGDGRRVDLTEVRSDPASGLALAKADTTAAPLTFSDQAFPRVGQFGLAVSTPAGAGCSAAASMIGSDFIADGGNAVGYVRLQPPPASWAPGMPLVGGDGLVLGIGIGSPPGAVIPAPIASVILDELIRNSLSASSAFGFRAVDFAAPFAARLDNQRSGAAIALVEPKSSSARAGLQAGDIVTAVDGRPVSSASELSRILDALPGKATLDVQRQSEQLEVTVKRSAGS
jgi:Trypsin-like serine proteases, typically periplasmic, contain C-terminal PDZ domain